MLTVGLLVGAVLSYLVEIRRERLEAGNSANQSVPIESSKSASIIVQTKQLSSAKSEQETRMAENPDAYWDPKRRGEEYRSKVIRNNQISQFLTSSRRDDPAYRAVMVKLLEHGYDLIDWVDFVGIASQYHMPVSLARSRLEAEGFVGDELDRELVPARAHQEALRQHVLATCRIVMGIEDPTFIDELLEIELPYAQGDQVLGVGPLAMIRGDRLYDEEDWLDGEFRSAIERYTGAARPRRDLSEPTALDSSEDEGVLPASKFDIPIDGN